MKATRSRGTAPGGVELLAGDRVGGKLLEECGICGRPIFWCRMASPARRVAVEVLEQRAGDVAIQTQIGVDDLAAVIVGSGTFYRLHHAQGRCEIRPFSKAPGAGKKVRP